MSASVLVLLGAVVFVVLIFSGRKALTAGANAQVANGAVLLVIGTVVGVALVLGIASLDGW